MPNPHTFTGDPKKTTESINTQNDKTICGIMTDLSLNYGHRIIRLLAQIIVTAC